MTRPRRWGNFFIPTLDLPCPIRASHTNRKTALAEPQNPDAAPTAENGAPDQPPSFEEALTELESLVERLESGEGSLEQALADFERGIGLARQCEARLSEAEQTVQQLVGEGEEAGLAPFTAGDAEGEGPGEAREGGE